MRILMIHNRYLYRGGEDQNFEARLQLLRERNHDVDVLIEDNARVAELGGLRTAQRTLWASDTHARVRQMLRDKHFDIIDVHNTFPLVSPAVYYAARSERVPVVQTLHNYRLVCPKATLYRNGIVCEDCLGRAVPWPGVVHACYRGSRFGTAAVVAMLAGHRLVRTWARAVDAYIAVSEFERRKLVQGGLPAHKMVVVQNFVHPDPGVGRHDGGYALFVGRLSPEKGVSTLLEAWSRLGGRFPLRIVGDGPMAPEVMTAAGRLKDVQWLGSRPNEEVLELMGEATVVVVPSDYYETFGVAAVEACARATPVVATGHGALAEIVEDGRTGLLIPPGQPDALVKAIDWIRAAGRSTLEAFGREARRIFEQKYTGAAAYTELMAAYRLAAQSART